MIQRRLENELLSIWDLDKVILLTGARQVGKTTLLKKICSSKGKFLYINGDDAQYRAQLENAGEQVLRRIIQDNKIVFVDEAQRIKDIGLMLKIIHDQIPNIKLIASGSSALELFNTLNEPLTGRKFHLKIYPISWDEIVDYNGYLKAISQLENHLIFGTYPEILAKPERAQEIIGELTDSYLYKDLLNYKGIRKPEVLDKLLLALALQVGSEVNYNELSRTIGLDRATIEQYISLLEKTYVLFRLNPLSRNLRTEINTSRKIYFYDNGIRNSIINNFNGLNTRNDRGALWENFLISNRIKHLAYSKKPTRFYFWRTYQQQEIDWIEERNGQFYAYEFKYKPKKVKFSKTFLDKYNPIETKIIHKDNFDEFLSERFDN